MEETRRVTSNGEKYVSSGGELSLCVHEGLALRPSMYLSGFAAKLWEAVGLDILLDGRARE